MRQQQDQWVLTLRHSPPIVDWGFITASRWQNAGLLPCCTGRANPPQASPAHCAPRMFPYPAGWLAQSKDALHERFTL